jgi:hypothetical protein
MERDWATAGNQRYRDAREGLCQGRCMAIHREQRFTERREDYIREIPGQIDCHLSLHRIWSHVVYQLIPYHCIVQWSTHSICPIFWSHWLFLRLHVDLPNCMDLHCRIVSYLLTLFLRSSSQNPFSWRIPFGCRERCSGVLRIGSLPSSSVVVPQIEPKHGFSFRKLSTE